MKRNKKSKWFITALIISVFMLTACQQNAPQAEQQNDMPIVTFQMEPSSRGVEDFIKGLEHYDAEDEGQYYNVVPEDISNDYGINIFKSDMTCYSALVYDNEKYRLGDFFGGFGVTSFAIADLNADGEFELYFTCSWGSGLGHGEVGYFDTASREIIIFVFDYFDELLLEVDGNNVLCVYNVDEDTSNFKSFVDIEMSAGKKIASIVFDNGELSFVVETD